MKVITVGRSQDNNVVLTDAKVSRVHLQIVLNDEGVCSVVDLNTTNGTFVNNRRITGEVQLNPNDVVRIGDTTVPWQDYLKSDMVATPRVEAAKATAVSEPSGTGNKNRTMLYVAICVVVFVVIAGGFGLYYYKTHRCGSQKEMLQKNDERRVSELPGDPEATNQELQREADDLYRQVLTSQNKKNRELALAKQKEADTAKRQAEEALAAREKAESEKMAAEQAKEASEKAKKTAEENSRRAINAAEEKEAKAQRELSVANKERDKAAESMKLTALFYKEMKQVSAPSVKKVLENLNLELPANADNAEDYLEAYFEKADNKKKQDIIHAIRVVKQQKSKKADKSKASTEEQEDSVEDNN